MCFIELLFSLIRNEVLQIIEKNALIKCEILFKLDGDTSQRIGLLLDDTADDKVAELMKVLHAALLIDLHADV